MTVFLAVVFASKFLRLPVGDRLASDMCFEPLVVWPLPFMCALCTESRRESARGTISGCLTVEILAVFGETGSFILEWTSHVRWFWSASF